VQGVVYVGPGVDRAWVRRVLRALDPAPRTLVLHRTPGGDPHVWLSLAAVETLTETLALWLEGLMPAQRAAIRDRADRYRARVRAVRDSLRRHEAASSFSPVVLAHSAWVNLFREQGIPVVGILHPVPEHPPGPRTLARILQQARAARVKWVIVDAGRRDATAESLAREIQARRVVLDPLGTCDRSEDPLTLILRNLRTLERARHGS